VINLTETGYVFHPNVLSLEFIPLKYEDESESNSQKIPIKHISSLQVILDSRFGKENVFSQNILNPSIT
jgi:hypothetical protein